MVATSTIILQSPAYDNNGHGDQIKLPVVNVQEGFDGEDTIAPTFSARTVIAALGFQKNVIQVSGFLTDQVASDFATEVNALNMRDKLRRVFRRDYYTAGAGVSPWRIEDGTLGGANWGNGTLPADQQDAGELRIRGKMRLILDKRYDAFSATQKTDLLYGVVTRIGLGPIMAVNMRVRMPYILEFAVGSVNSV